MEKEPQPREIGISGISNLDAGGNYTAPVAEFDLAVLADEHIGPRDLGSLTLIKPSNRVELGKLVPDESFD